MAKPGLFEQPGFRNRKQDASAASWKIRIAMNFPACRSEDRSLASAAGKLLRESSYSPLRNISCDQRNGTLILHGRVTSYYMKQMAQVLIRQINPEKGIDNRIEVVDA